ncbi:hypothetical protein M409DRAFT_19086 [Zasmidium cellare ATCC 36951]|uniref:Uncharacterized protein n=1 Tax=Zasmidium cellare ATCC 36951 TaxID=1080233 RepID=A0A6A6CVP9_ZASCE|nr:uncharacterized protein M409DRAFT_19086 [Zasmidium cellare ATCC 36951]KAF2171115.1 hypothetical protein M409DRAFT_19086 [Zasmidium cellare ATCC 36951]
MPTSNPDTNHQPLHALVALLLAYYLLAATTRLKTSLVDTILLRSFPRWAEKYTVLQHTHLHPWLRPCCLNAVVGIAVAVGWRVWMGEGTRLWVVVARVTPGWMLLEMGVVGVLWGVEQFLRWTYKAGKAVGWVPCDEVEEAWARLSVLRKGNPPESPDSQDSQMLDSAVVSPSDEEIPVQHPQRNSHSDLQPSSHDQPAKSPFRLSEYHRLYKFLTNSFQGAKIEESTGTTTYHSITAEKKYQNKSFEELRVQHYRDVHGHGPGSERFVQEEEQQSFLGRSWSYLTDSLFGGESLASWDSFGRSTAVARDSVRGDGARIGEGRGVVPDLLTGTPRRLFT